MPSASQPQLEKSSNLIHVTIIINTSCSEKESVLALTESNTSAGIKL